MNDMSLRNESAARLVTYVDNAPPSLNELRRPGQAENKRIRANELIIQRTARDVLIGWLNQAHRLALAVDIHGLKGTAFERFAAEIGIERTSAYELYKLDARRDAIMRRCEREDHWPEWRSVLKPANPSPSKSSVALAKKLQRKLDAEQKAKGALVKQVQKLKAKRRNDQARDGEHQRWVLPWQHESDDWGTPAALFDFLNKLYDFDVDVCATQTSTKCKAFFHDGERWPETGMEIRSSPLDEPALQQSGLMGEKASDSAQAGAIVVGLFANRSATRWYRDYVVPYGLVVQLYGRVTFIQQGKPVIISCKISRHPAPHQPPWRRVRLVVASPNGLFAQVAHAIRAFLRYSLGDAP